MVEACGNMYQGEYKAGRYHGDGKLSYADGDAYEGQCGARVRSTGTASTASPQATRTRGSGVRARSTAAAGSPSPRASWRSAATTRAQVFSSWKMTTWHVYGVHAWHIGKVCKWHGCDVCMPHRHIRCFDARADVGQGVRWSADRALAWRLQDGKQGRSISLEGAAKIAQRIGLPPP